VKDQLIGNKVTIRRRRVKQEKIKYKKRVHYDYESSLMSFHYNFYSLFCFFSSHDSIFLLI